MRVVCAWCKKVLREGGEPISHGICEECAEVMKQEIKQTQAEGPRLLADAVRLDSLEEQQDV